MFRCGAAEVSEIRIRILPCGSTSYQECLAYDGSTLSSGPELWLPPTSSAHHLITVGLFQRPLKNRNLEDVETGAKIGIRWNKLVEDITCLRLISANMAGVANKGIIEI